MWSSKKPIHLGLILKSAMSILTCKPVITDILAIWKQQKQAINTTLTYEYITTKLMANILARFFSYPAVKEQQ